MESRMDWFKQDRDTTVTMLDKALRTRSGQSRSCKATGAAPADM